MGRFWRLFSRTPAAPKAPSTEPGRSLARLQARGTRLHLEPSGSAPRHGRKEPDLQVAWWWHDGPRTVVLGERVVSISAPSDVRGGPLRFTDADQIVLVGVGHPAPGGVERARDLGLTFAPDAVVWPSSPLPATTTPKALARLLGRSVKLRVVGGATVDHNGALRREGTDHVPVPRGRLVAAEVGCGHVVLILDDRTVAVLHEPCRVRSGADGTVRLSGDLGRVVIDVPTPDVHVARDATLEVRPTSDPPR